MKEIIVVEEKKTVRFFLYLCYYDWKTWLQKVNSIVFQKDERKREREREIKTL